jgi:hypothetical protein
MHFFTALSVLAVSLPLVVAYPQPITDPEELASLQKRYETVEDKLRRGDYYPVPSRRVNESESLEERQLIGKIAGLLVTSDLLKPIVDQITDSLIGTFEDSDEIWENSDHCRLYTRTRGGGNCMLGSYPRGHEGDSEQKEWDWNCAWTGNEPPIGEWEHPGIGKFSVRYTATQDWTWGDDAVKCDGGIEGLCHPQYIFYRNEHEIVMNTWRK